MELKKIIAKTIADINNKTFLTGKTIEKKGVMNTDLQRKTLELGDTKNSALNISKQSVTAYQSSAPENQLTRFISQYKFSNAEQLAYLTQTLADEELLDIFKKSINDELLEKLQNNKQLLSQYRDGMTDEITILKLKLCNFDNITVEFEPRKTFALINAILPLLTDIIVNKNGFIEKISGANITAYFGIPKTPLNLPHQLQAVNTAVELQKVGNYINKNIKLFNPPIIEFSIGIETGRVKAGFIGGSASAHKTFTVIGKPLILARKYCIAAKENEIMIGENLIDSIIEFYRINPQPQIISLKTREYKFYQVYY